VDISVKAIRELREKTAAGIMDCKRALQQARGDPDRAEEILREQGTASAAKKAARETNQGLVESYIHNGGRIGAMVEVNCETDFVARTTEFQNLAHDLAMQVAAMSPRYIDVSDVPEGEQVVHQEACLLQQPFIKDPARSVQDLMNEAIGKLGENVKVGRFARLSIGE
jgi:elongation factor Ts